MFRRIYFGLCSFRGNQSQTHRIRNLQSNEGAKSSEDIVQEVFINLWEKRRKQNLNRIEKNENDKYENKSKDYLGVEKRG